MNPPPESPPDPLLTRYREASRDSAGAPSTATRAAILAEARAAALRRLPAANDARWKLRAAAGLAVVGLGVALWLQLEPRQRRQALSDSTAPAAAPASAPLAAPSRAPLPAPSPAPSPAASSELSATVTLPTSSSEADAATRQRADTYERRSARSAEPLAAAPAAPPVGSAPAADVGRVNESVATVAKAESAAVPAARSAVQSDPFLGIADREPPPAALWLLRDPAGHVLQAGELAAEERIEDRYAAYEREHPGARIVERALGQRRNARGVTVPLYTARVVDGRDPQ